MKVLTLEIAAMEQQKPLRWSSSDHFELKSKKALRRYYLCKKRRRAEHHINQAIHYSTRAFDVLPKVERNEWFVFQ